MPNRSSVQKTESIKMKWLSEKGEKNKNNCGQALILKSPCGLPAIVMWMWTSKNQMSISIFERWSARLYEEECIFAGFSFLKML